MTPRRGWFVTLEGPEGGGKTTQIGFLAKWFRDRGWEVVTTQEPGGEPLANRIRELLLHTDGPISARTELLLYLAARAQHVERVIRPALEAGKVVLCDRFADSTMAYQGYARGLDKGFVRGANEFATGGLEPDLTIVIDIPVEKGLGRQMARNRMEEESIEFHRKVRKGFLDIARDEPYRVVVVDGSADAETVRKRIISVVEERFGK